jgi:hypothetical protein
VFIGDLHLLKLCGQGKAVRNPMGQRPEVPLSSKGFLSLKKEVKEEGRFSERA